MSTKIPGAVDKIADYKFHVAQHLSQAVDEVRRQENKVLLAEGDEQLEATSNLRLRHPDHLSEDTWQAFEPLRDSALKTARAWAIKELAMSLWQYRTRAGRVEPGWLGSPGQTRSPRARSASGQYDQEPLERHPQCDRPWSH